MLTETATCEICGSGQVKVRRVARTYGKGAELLVIENVPVISCPDCGESYLMAETLHEIEQVKQNRRRLAVERSVAVSHYQ